MRLFAIILIVLPMSVLHGLPYAEHDIGGVSFDLKTISDGRSEKISDTRNREGLSIHVQTVDVLDGRFVLSSGQVTALCLNIVSNTPENWDVDFISLVFKLPQGVRLVDYTREINVSRTLQWWKSIYVLCPWTAEDLACGVFLSVGAARTRVFEICHAGLNAPTIATSCTTSERVRMNYVLRRPILAKAAAEDAAESRKHSGAPSRDD